MVRNKNLYKLFKDEQWILKIKKRRLSWFGHLMRLNEKTPAQEALKESERKVKKIKGGQKLTWMKLIKDDLKKIDDRMTFDEWKENAKDKKSYNLKVMHNRMSSSLDESG